MRSLPGDCGTEHVRTQTRVTMFDNRLCYSPPRPTCERHAGQCEEETMRRTLMSGAVVGGAIAIGLGMWGTRSVVSTVSAADALSCPVQQGALKSNLVIADANDTTGLNNHYWAVVVNREGVVCAVAYSGATRDAQWLLSRQIAAAKAFTANGLSLNGAPLSTAQLYPWVQPGAPGNPLFGLAAGNPVSPDAAYN